MLVVFNSGYRVGYVENVFRTLFLPSGADNEYRYRIGADAQVSSDEIASIKAQRRQPALICFGDRYSSNDDGSPAYRFYPLRRGEVVDVTESGGRLFVKIRLDDFVNAASPEDYTSELYRLAARDNFNLLQFSGHPENDKDGRYVYAVNDEATLLDPLEKGPRTWLATVQQLEVLTTFKTKLQEAPIFSRVSVESRRQPVAYETVKKAQMARLEKDDDLRLVVNYYFPSQSADTAARAVLKVGSPVGAQILAPATHELGMKENRIEIPVVFEPGSDKRYFSFDINFEQVHGGPVVVGVSESVLLCATDAYWRQLAVAFAVFFYVIGSVVLAKQNPLGGAMLQAISLIMMLKFAGKKVV